FVVVHRPEVARCTSAPAATRAAADSSERAKPTTLYLASRSSGMTTETMCPDAPVTNTRMSLVYFPVYLRQGLQSCCARTRGLNQTTLGYLQRLTSFWQALNDFERNAGDAVLVAVEQVARLHGESANSN